MRCRDTCVLREGCLQLDMLHCPVMPPSGTLPTCFAAVTQTPITLAAPLQSFLLQVCFPLLLLCSQSCFQALPLGRLLLAQVLQLTHLLLELRKQLHQGSPPSTTSS